MRLSSKTVEIGETVLNPDFLSWSSLAMGYLGGRGLSCALKRIGEDVSEKLD